MYAPPTVTGLSKYSPVLPSISLAFPVIGNLALFNSFKTCSGVAPLKTGVEYFLPETKPTHPSMAS